MSSLALLTTHRVVAGRYEVGEVIGRGGSATVHRGRDLRSGRSVAVKVLRPGLAGELPFHSRLRREARILAGLRHPAIVSVLDAGYTDPGEGWPDGGHLPFLVMEYVAGRSLRQVLDEGGPTLEESVHYQVGVLSALGSSHRAGVVHRDVKPANVMITPQGHVKVVDFGIARFSADPSTTVTHLGVFGTPLYVSPERVLGEPADARSDIYSAGCLLYELLTGQPPFAGDDPVSVAYHHVHEEPERASAHNPELSDGIDGVLQRALAKDRNDRFPTARHFSQALASAVRDASSTTYDLPHEHCA